VWYMKKTMESIRIPGYNQEPNYHFFIIYAVMIIVGALLIVSMAIGGSLLAIHVIESIHYHMGGGV
jgi:hypothetical protein